MFPPSWYSQTKHLAVTLCAQALSMSWQSRALENDLSPGLLHLRKIGCGQLCDAAICISSFHRTAGFFYIPSASMERSSDVGTHGQRHTYGVHTYKYLFLLRCGRVIFVVVLRKVVRARTRRVRPDKHRPVFPASKISAWMKEIERHFGTEHNAIVTRPRITYL